MGMTAQTKRLTIADQLLALLERLRRKPKGEPPDIIGLHLHDRPRVEVQTTDGALHEMRLGGGCFYEDCTVLRFVLTTPEPINVKRFRLTLGKEEQWETPPDGFVDDSGTNLTFSWQLLSIASTIDADVKP